MAQAKVHKSSFLACPRSLMVSGKQQSSFPSFASTFSDILIPLGWWGWTLVLQWVFLCLSPCLVLRRIFSLSLMLELLSLPSISTPTAPLNQQSGVPGVTLGLPSMVPIMGLGLSAPSSVGFSLGPNLFPPPTLDLCGTPSLSDNLSSSGSKSSEGSRIRYSLRNRTVLSGDLDICDAEDPPGPGLGSLPRASSSARGRGRRSHLLLAQDRAKLDVASGRQSSIEWALREKKPNDLVPL
jgi:hypothetical protein